MLIFGEKLSTCNIVDEKDDNIYKYDNNYQRHLTQELRLKKKLADKIIIIVDTLIIHNTFTSFFFFFWIFS